MPQVQIDTSIFKGYDIRGVYPEQINEELAYKIAQGFVEVMKPVGEVLVGHDVRIHSEELKRKVIEGLTDAGVNVVDAGEISTDMSYFGIGYYKLAGAMQVTASHNPPEWHGIKMTAAGVVPLTLESGIGQIRDFVVSGEPIHQLAEKTKGQVRQQDILNDYAQFVLSFIDPSKVKPMKVVINGNFGFAARIFQKIVELGKLPLEIIPLNAEPDGTFPKGRPDPFIPENRDEFSKLVKESGANLGIAWDADADRVFFCADGGIFVEPYHLNNLLIRSLLQKHLGEKVIYDIRYTWGLIDAIKESGGVPVASRVGHSYIKENMRKENALFATESSGHTYFRDFWYADCGMIPAALILEYLSLQDKLLSELVAAVMDKYPMSGEINNTVSDVKAKIGEISEKYKDGEQSRLDGITVDYADYRFNVRPSNTEPLLRLNVEAKTKELMEQKRDELLALIKS